MMDSNGAKTETKFPALKQPVEGAIASENAPIQAASTGCATKSCS